MDLTIIQQGSFISTGAVTKIPLRSGVDWMRVYNLTVMGAAQVAAVGSEYYWQLGFAPGSAIEYRKSNAANADNLVLFNTTGGFTLFDDSINIVGILHTDVTAISAAAIPVVTETAANGLSAGDTIRLTNVTGGLQLGGIDFTVGYSTLTAGTFSLEYMPQIAAATTGNWQVINITSPFYPRRRVITAISNAVQAVIRMSVTHGFTVGQKVRVSVPAGFGMLLPPTQATILAINTSTAAAGNTITVDIDTTTLAAFVFPITTAAPFTPALVTPMGEDTATALLTGNDILADATINTETLGMKLAAGVDSPAGQASDVIFWVAGKSFNK